MSGTKGKIIKIEISLSGLKRVFGSTKKIWDNRRLRFLFLTSTAVILLLGSYEIVNAVGAYYLVERGRQFYEEGNYQEALNLFKKAGSFWDRTLVLRRVKVSPADWRVSKVTSMLAEELETSPSLNSFEPDIEIVNWQLKHYRCSTYVNGENNTSVSCNKISTLPPLVRDAYAFDVRSYSQDDYSPVDSAVLIAKIKNKSSFPAFYVDMVLKYSNGERNQIIDPSELTYIPAGGEKEIQKVLLSSPQGAAAKLEAKGVIYNEDDKFSSKLHEIKLLDISLVGKPTPGYQGEPEVTIRFKNTSGKKLTRIGVSAFLKVTGPVACMESGNQTFAVVPYFPFSTGTDNYLSVFVVDKTKQGSPTVEKHITARPDEIVTYTNRVYSTDTSCGCFSSYCKSSGSVDARVFGLESE